MARSRERRETVSFLSDYGLDDEFVGVVKSVLRRLAPHAAVIDITHGVTAHDIRAGSLALARAAPFLVPGVVLAVVDPEVATDRRAIAVEAGEDAGWVFVGPDNGLLMPAVVALGGPGRAVALTERRRMAGTGPTFDGRDLFAPSAAGLCNGADLVELGHQVDPASLVPGPRPSPRRSPTGVSTEVLWVDRFGNAQLAATEEDLADLGQRIRLVHRGGDLVVRRTSAFAALEEGEVGLVVDSCGMIAVALDRRSAAAELGLTAGDEVVLSRT